MTSVKEIENLKNQLVSSSSKSIFSNAHPKKSIDKIDILEFCNLCNDTRINPTFIFQSLFYDRSFTIKLKVSYLKSDKNKSKRKILNIFRKNEDLIQEINHDSFALGYPLICLPDNKRKLLRFIPIFIWDLKIFHGVESSGQLVIKKKQRNKGYINPIFIEIIRENFENSYKDLLKIFENTQIYNYTFLLNKIAQITGIAESYNFTKETIFSFKKNSLKYSKNFAPTFCNNGVFGLYQNSKAPIIKDYRTILDTFNFEDYELFKKKEFSQIHSQPTVFSGVKLDHSQQKVLKSIQSKKDIVIHGPPGTGKSKTLTGIISYALSHEKKCIVICEKKTAIDVIYKNLSELGLEEFCIRIDNVKSDRRKVVNKARQLLSGLDYDGINLFESKLRSNISSNHKTMIQKKKDHIFSIISEIKSKKQKLYKILLNKDVNLSYSDIVLSVFGDSIDISQRKIEINEYNLNFNSQEYDSIQQLFEKVKLFVNENMNPFNSIYEFLNPDVFESWDFVQYETSISNLYKQYYEEITSLKDRFSYEFQKTSSNSIMHYSLISEENAVLSKLIKEITILKKRIFQTSIFNREFKNALSNPNLEYQINFLLKTIKSAYIERLNYHDFKKFYRFLIPLSNEHQSIVKNYCKISNFKPYFNCLYLKSILDRNHVDNFNFNGCQRGYYDIIQDIDLINEFLINQTSLTLKKIRSRAISKFKNENKKFTIEQFFSKKSTQKNKKLSLRQISSHPSKIFNSFFPLVLTNPSSCSTLFPMENDFFDLVVFDESSQIKIEDCIPALIRAKQRVVAGDLNQLPPMSYFKKTIVNSADKKEINVSTKSLLDFCIDQKFKEHYLDIHYRSKHPELINFSNHAFYKSRLIPLPKTTNHTPFEFIELHGIFDQGINRMEIQKIIDYLENKIDPNYSVGIATFNIHQRDEIMDQIGLKSAKNPLFFEKIKKLRSNGFFVKNIESIQGEERDIIIISSTYGKSPQGFFRQSFGPINSNSKGFKLLNVIITRARHKVIVFSSIPNGYIEKGLVTLNEKNENRGKSIFYAFLAFVKSVSNKDEVTKQKIIQILQKNSNLIKKFSSNENKKILESFSNRLLKIISDKTEKSFSMINNFSLGGFVYEIFLFDKHDTNILIDLNGKFLHGDFEDYLFDINRSNLAINSGYKYYRLWTSNIQNNFDQEIFKIVNFINHLN